MPVSHWMLRDDMRSASRLPGTDIREVWIKSGNRYAVTLANGINVSGMYTWDISGSRIVLDIRGDRSPFFVGENFLKYEGSGKQKDWTFQKM